MTLSAFAFSTMSLLISLASKRDQFPSSQFVLCRSVVQVSLAYLWTIIADWPKGTTTVWGPKGMRKFLVMRGTAGSCGLALFYHALTRLSLADATGSYIAIGFKVILVIFFTGPSLTALLAWLVLKEPLTRLDVAALISCLFGVVLVSRPSFLFADDGKVEPVSDTSAAMHVEGVLAASIGAVFSAMAYTSVRYVTRLDPSIPAMVRFLLLFDNVRFTCFILDSYRRALAWFGSTCNRQSCPRTQRLGSH
jgi:drug/metabolite transporter (DMT)-like permease